MTTEGRRPLGERALHRHAARGRRAAADGVRRGLEPHQAGRRVDRLAARRHPAGRVRLTTPVAPSPKTAPCSPPPPSPTAFSSAKPGRASGSPRTRAARSCSPSGRWRPASAIDSTGPHRVGAALGRRRRTSRCRSRRWRSRRSWPTRRAGTRSVTADGDAALAATLRDLALTLPWFVEQAFAKALGPIVGQRVADAGRRLLAFPEYAVDRVGEASRSYARDEADLLAARRRSARLRRRRTRRSPRASTRWRRALDALAARLPAAAAPAAGVQSLTGVPRAGRAAVPRRRQMPLDVPGSQRVRGGVATPPCAASPAAPGGRPHQRARAPASSSAIDAGTPPRRPPESAPAGRSRSRRTPRASRHWRRSPRRRRARTRSAAASYRGVNPRYPGMDRQRVAEEGRAQVLDRVRADEPAGAGGDVARRSVQRPCAVECAVRDVLHPAQVGEVVDVAIDVDDVVADGDAVAVDAGHPRIIAHRATAARSAAAIPYNRGMRILRLARIVVVALKYGLDEFLTGHERFRAVRPLAARAHVLARHLGAARACGCASRSRTSARSSSSSGRCSRRGATCCRRTSPTSSRSCRTACRRFPSEQVARHARARLRQAGRRGVPVVRPRRRSRARRSRRCTSPSCPTARAVAVKVLRPEHRAGDRERPRADAGRRRCWSRSCGPTASGCGRARSSPSSRRRCATSST